MASYTATVRTNYFRVTNEEKYQELIKGLNAEMDIDFWDKTDENGVLRHGFGACNVIEYSEVFKTVKEVLSEIKDPKSIALALNEVIDDNLEYGSVKILDEPFSEDEQENHYVYHIRNFEDGKTILYISEHPNDYLDIDMHTFFERLQEILPEDEAFICQEVGNEKLKYLVGITTIVTKNEIKYLSMEEIVKEETRKMLSDPEFETQLDY